MSEDILKTFENQILGKQKNANTFVDRSKFTDSIVSQALKNVAFHHVESFNFAFGQALERAVNYLPPLELVFP